VKEPDCRFGEDQGLLPRREQSFREAFKRSDRIRAYITEVKRASSARSHSVTYTSGSYASFRMEVLKSTGDCRD